MMFDDVISGEKAPLVRILRHVTSGSHAGRAHLYILYYYYSKKKVREPVVHAHAITSVTDVTSGSVTSGDTISGQGRFRSRDFR